MNDKATKLERPLFINMPTDEALERFIRADPKEAGELAKRAKERRGPPTPRRRSKANDGEGG